MVMSESLSGKYCEKCSYGPIVTGQWFRGASSKPSTLNPHISLGELRARGLAFWAPGACMIVQCYVPSSSLSSYRSLTMVPYVE